MSTERKETATRKGVLFEPHPLANRWWFWVCYVAALTLAPLAVLLFVCWLGS